MDGKSRESELEGKWMKRKKKKKSSFQLSSSNFALKVFDIGQSSFFSNYRRSHYYLKYDWTIGNMKGSAENTFPIRPHPFPVAYYSTYCPSIISRSCLSWVRGSRCSAAENLDWDWPSRTAGLPEILSGHMCDFHDSQQKEADCIVVYVSCYYTTRWLKDWASKERIHRSTE